jgi:hypothetical protein
MEGPCLDRGGLSQADKGDTARPTLIPALCTHLGKEGGETLYGKPVRGELSCLLCFCRYRCFSGSHRVPCCAILVQLLVIKKNGCKGLPHVPLYVVGQRAEEDVDSHVVRGPVPYETDKKIDALQCPEGSFHLGQILVISDHVSRRKPVGRLTRPDHIDSYEYIQSDLLVKHKKSMGYHEIRG